MVPELNGVGSSGRSVHPGSLGSLVYALVVAGFLRGHCVHWDSPLRSSSSSGVARFIVVRRWGC